MTPVAHPLCSQNIHGEETLILGTDLPSSLVSTQTLHFIEFLPLDGYPSVPPKIERRKKSVYQSCADTSLRGVLGSIECAQYTQSPHNVIPCTQSQRDSAPKLCTLTMWSVHPISPHCDPYTQTVHPHNVIHTPNLTM